MPLLPARDNISPMAPATTTCPGCGLELPHTDIVHAQGYHASSECWSVYTEVLAAEFGNAALFGQVHQMTVDSYAVQHAGGPHEDKSIAVHLVGLYLVLERGISPPDVPARLQRLASAVSSWPHFPVPDDVGPLTVFDVALADSPPQHAECVQMWARQLWRAWRPQHAAIAKLAEHCHVETAGS